MTACTKPGRSVVIQQFVMIVVTHDFLQTVTSFFQEWARYIIIAVQLDEVFRTTATPSKTFPSCACLFFHEVLGESLFFIFSCKQIVVVAVSLNYFFRAFASMHIIKLLCEGVLLSNVTNDLVITRYHELCVGLQPIKTKIV